MFHQESIKREVIKIEHYVNFKRSGLLDSPGWFGVFNSRVYLTVSQWYDNVIHGTNVTICWSCAVEMVYKIIISIKTVYTYLKPGSHDFFEEPSHLTDVRGQIFLLIHLLIHTLWGRGKTDIFLHKNEAYQFLKCLAGKNMLF